LDQLTPLRWAFTGRDAGKNKYYLKTVLGRGHLRYGSGDENIKRNLRETDFDGSGMTGFIQHEISEKMS
jgi:hypothetical protein